MARKGKSSPLEVMLDLVAMLPWWVGVVLGLVGYLLLHRLATPISVTGVQPGQVAGLMQQAVIKGLATAGQYIIPIICFAGAALSAWRRKQRQSLVSAPMATPNCSTYGRSNCSRQDGRMVTIRGWR